nr:microsomal glutathione s-transferase 3 [Quercus suber]
MSTLALTVPRDYGYVLVTLSGTFFLGLYHALRVGPYRRAARMPYPKAYADSGDFAAATTDAQRQALYLFNCVQRAHNNFLENAWSFSVALLDKKDGSGRLVGSGFWLAQVALYGMAGWMGVKMVL